MKRFSAFSFEIPAILKHDLSAPSQKPLKCMYMCLYGLRRAQITRVSVTWRTYHTSAHYAWARTFRPHRMDV